MQEPETFAKGGGLLVPHLKRRPKGVGGHEHTPVLVPFEQADQVGRALRNQEASSSR
jgi:hypothetical protein